MASPKRQERTAVAGDSGFYDWTSTAETNEHKQLAVKAESTHVVPIVAGTSPEVEGALRVARITLAGAVVTAVISALASLGTAVINQIEPASPVNCVQAIQNVEQVSNMNLTDPTILGNVNPPDVDKQCGDEQAILKALGR